MCYDGFEYVMVFVLMCLGKGVGLVVLILLFWIGSVVIYDIKGENWEFMFGWWFGFFWCVWFDLIDWWFLKYNLFMGVCCGEYEVCDV